MIEFFKNGISIYLALLTIVTIARAIRKDFIVTNNYNLFIPVLIFIISMLLAMFIIIFIDSEFSGNISYFVKVPFFLSLAIIGYLVLVFISSD